MFCWPCIPLHSLKLSPTRCTILLNIFISLLYMFRKSMWPSSGDNYCIYATLVFVTLCGWRLVCWLDSIQTADHTPPIQSDKYQCRIDTVIFSWWWAHGCLKHVEKWNKHIKQNCAPSWTNLQEVGRMFETKEGGVRNSAVCYLFVCCVMTSVTPNILSLLLAGLVNNNLGRI